MSYRRETISINLGQAGVQVGNATWQLYCLEQGVTPDGHFLNPSDDCDIGFRSFFDETIKGKMVPRSIFIDTEPTVVDEVRCGKYKHLFHPDQLISGKQDAANNFVRGYLSPGQTLIENVQEKIRQLIERTENCQGFFLTHSFGGGTGSGFSANIMDFLVDEYSRRAKFQFVVYPAPSISSTVVEPYNAVLTTHSTLDQTDCAFMFDNQALYDIARNKLNVDYPTYSNLNSLMNHVISSITASLRFNGTLNVDLDDFRTNLVPFPRIHFPIASYAPFYPAEKEQFEYFTTAAITNEAFELNSQMMKCDMGSGKYMACCMLYRGDVIAKDINCAIQMIKQKNNVQFVDWCPTGFKIGINSSPPKYFPERNMAMSTRGVSMIASNTAIADAFGSLNCKFDMMFAKRAFVHWYINEGMELADFQEARYNLAALEMDYEEVSGDFQSSQKEI
jgi:tubulin alpha